MEEVRIDKWLWATRVFKTRTIAADACKKGRVMINNVTVKPSRMIKVGEVIQVRKPPVTFSFKVLALSESRMWNNSPNRHTVATISISISIGIATMTTRNK